MTRNFVSYYFMPPIALERFTGNGNIPQASFGRRVAQQFNLISNRLRRQVVARARTLETLIDAEATIAGAYYQWPFFFRTGENTAGIHVAIGQVRVGVSGAGRIDIRRHSDDVVVASIELNYTGNAGDVTPNEIHHGSHKLSGLSANTDYYGEIELTEFARVAYLSIVETPESIPFAEDTVAGVASPGNFVDEGPIYDEHMEDLLEANNLLWQHNGAHLLDWSVDNTVDGGFPIDATSGFKNIFNFETSVTSSSIGFNLFTPYHNTLNRTTVPVILAVYVANSTSVGSIEVRLTDGANSVTFAPITHLSTTGKWFVTTGTVPPQNGTKWDIQAKVSDGIYKLYGVILQEWEGDAASSSGGSAELQQQLAAISYFYPTNSDWDEVESLALAGKLTYALINPDNGPGYRATYDSGGSAQTDWSTRLTSANAAGATLLGYVSTNYFDSKSAHSSDPYRGTCGAEVRFTANPATDVITTVDDGTLTLAGSPGSARTYTFANGFGPVGVKPWDPTLGGALPTGLSQSTSYYLRATTALPCSVWSLHTSEAGAIANTGKVLFSTSGTGPLFLGLRRDTANVQNILDEMDRYITLYPTLGGWFFDESSTVDDAAYDATWDAIIAHRDANHPGLVICVNGMPDTSARAAVFDLMMYENSYTNWLAYSAPSWVLDGTIAASKFWAGINGASSTAEAANAVTLTRNANFMHVSVVGGSYSRLPVIISDGFDNDDVIDAIDAGNA